MDRPRRKEPVAIRPQHPDGDPVPGPLERQPAVRPAQGADLRPAVQVGIKAGDQDEAAQAEGQREGDDD